MHRLTFSILGITATVTYPDKLKSEALAYELEASPL
jgi:hypothetical protein